MKPQLRDDGSVAGLKPHQHAHTCGCGAVLVCVRDCGVPREFQCPSCDLQQRDEHLSRVYGEQDLIDDDATALAHK